MKLKLERPLAVFDIESTGLNKKRDRIIDLAIVKLMPDGSRDERVYRVNPEMPIPSGAAAVHGITDDDVKDAPTFKEVAGDVAAFLENSDLCGFNLLSYDIPMLEEEFLRAEVPFSMEGRRVVDAQRIFHRMEPRDLTAALLFYRGEDHKGAHGALPDVEATIKVLEGQLEKYADLPGSVDELSDFCNPRDPDWVDQTGRLKWDDDGDAIINFGKNQGRKLRELAETDSGFLRWMLKSDFPDDTKDIIRRAQNQSFPRR